MDPVDFYSDYTCYVAISINAADAGEAAELIGQTVRNTIDGALLAPQRQARVRAISPPVPTSHRMVPWMHQLQFDIATRGEIALRALRSQAEMLMNAFADLGQNGRRNVRVPAKDAAADIGDALIDLDSMMGWNDDD